MFHIPRPTKRKHRPSGKSRQKNKRTQYSDPPDLENRYDDDHESSASTALPDHSLFIQAYEADLVRGPQAWAAAESLEVVRANGEVRAGDGLIRWGDTRSDKKEYENENDEDQTEDRQQEDIWVDRYDVRLLLDALPTFSAPSSSPLSSSGWSELPSDAEDTFFLAGPDLEDYHRQKRRRVMDAAREERLRALGDAEPTAQSDREKEEWGDSDEEPDDAQRELMRRTAMHLSNSPNPAQLEMRILANHGADRRFAFLRGRWGRAWRTAKAGVRMEKEEKKEGGGLGGLAGYGDSDEDENSANGEGKPDTGKGAETGADKMSPSATEQVVIGEDEEALKAARRAKAKEWAARRRAAKEAD